MEISQQRIPRRLLIADGILRGDKRDISLINTLSTMIYHTDTGNYTIHIRDKFTFQGLDGSEPNKHEYPESPAYNSYEEAKEVQDKAMKHITDKIENELLPKASMGAKKILDFDNKPVIERRELIIKSEDIDEIVQEIKNSDLFNVWSEKRKTERISKDKIHTSSEISNETADNAPAYESPTKPIKGQDVHELVTKYGEKNIREMLERHGFTYDNNYKVCEKK